MEPCIRRVLRDRLDRVEGLLNFKTRSMWGLLSEARTVSSEIVRLKEEQASLKTQLRG